MEPDHKASQGAFGAAASTKKRQISFRLAIPSKRPKLPYEQRTAASTFTSFYVEGGTNATPETPSSGTTNWDDDPFYDQDTELAAATASSGLQSHYSKAYYHDAFQVAPQFSDPVPIIDLAGSQDDTARSSLGSSHTHSDLEQEIFDRLQKAYEVVQSQDLFKDSPVWSTLLEAKLNAPSDPRFTPKLMDALTSKLQVSVVLNLYASGFSFDEQEQIYPYARNTISVLDAINYGILVGQLENSLPKTLATVVDGVSKPAQLYFYDGGIIVEVRDYREGRAKMNPTTQTMIPNKTKLFLRPDHHGILHYIDSQPVQPRIRSIVEQGIVYYLHPDLHLNPDVEQTRFLHALHSSFQKANIPYKQRIAKRRATFMPSRSVHSVPSVLSYSGEDELLAEEAEAASSTPPSLIDPSQATMDTTDPAVPSENVDATANEGPTKPVQTLPQHPSTTTAPIASAPSRLFKHLQSINFAMDYHKEADSGQTHSEKKRPYAVRSDPTLKEPVLSHPQVVGHFLFTIQQRAGGMQGGQPPLDYATLEINNRSAGGTQPFEMMHTSLRYGNGKALHFQSGGPASTSRLLNQFKKLETPATNEQVKHWQTPPAAQAPRMPTGPNAPGMPAVGPNMGPGAGMPNQQQGHGGPVPPSVSSPHPGHGHPMPGSGPMQAMPGSSSGPNAGGAMDQHAGMMSMPGSSSSPHAGQHMPQNAVGGVPPGAVRGGMPGQQQQHPQGGQARPLMPGMPGVASVPPSQGQPQGGPPMQHPGMAGVVRPKQPMPGAPGSVMAPQGGQGQQVMYQGKPNPNSMPGQQPSAGGQPSMGMMNMQQGMGGAHPGGMPGQHQQHLQHQQGPLQGSPHGLQGQGGMQQSSRPPVGSVAAPMPGMIKHTLPTGQPMGANAPGMGTNAKYGSPMPVGSAPLHGSAGMPRPITAATTKFAVGAPTTSSTASTGGATASMSSRPVGVKVATPVSASSGPGQNPNASPASPYTAAGNRRAPKKK